MTNYTMTKGGNIYKNCFTHVITRRTLARNILYFFYFKSANILDQAYKLRSTEKKMGLKCKGRHVYTSHLHFCTFAAMHCLS